MPRSFLIKKSSRAINYTSNSPNNKSDHDAEKQHLSEHENDHEDDDRLIVDLNYDNKGPYDLSIKSRPLKEANKTNRDNDLPSEKAKDASLLISTNYSYAHPHFTNAQLRGTPLYMSPQQSANAAKCMPSSPHHQYSPRGHPFNGEYNGLITTKPAFTPLEPLNTNSRSSPSRSPLTSPTIAKPLPITPYIPFGFSGFGYNENRNIIPASYYHHHQQSRHLDYPISPPQTPIMRERGHAMEENHHSHHLSHAHIRALSPEYRPQFMASHNHNHWNEQITLKSALANSNGSVGSVGSGSLPMTSPTPSLNGSDNDSGRGSVHSRESGTSLEVTTTATKITTTNGSKYHEMVKTENGKQQSRKAVSSLTCLEGNGQSQRYQCNDCNKSYSTYSGLSKHKEFHCSTQTKKAFSCKHCEKVYVSLGALKMHIRTHTLPCKCKLCGKAFSRPWLLQGHIRTHTGEKPFACQHCSRAFADRSNLRAHLQTHSDIKKYSCKSCSKTFSRMSLLLKHEDGGCSSSGSIRMQ